MRITLLEHGQHQRHESLVDLFCELHAYYYEASEVTREQVEAHLAERLLAADSPLKLVVALDDEGGVAALAAIALTYSLVDPRPGHRRQCHMKELYVRSSERGRGVGRALMAWIACYAERHDCGRIDFHVKDSNEAGIAFYTRLGAARVAERSSYRIGQPALRRLAAHIIT